MWTFTNGQTLEIVASLAGTLHYSLAAVDLDAVGATDVAPVQGSLITASTLVALAAPAAGVTRKLNYLAIKNKGAAANTVTLQKDVGGTKTELLAKLLAAGETLMYADGHVSVHAPKAATSVPALKTLTLPINKPSLGGMIAGQYGAFWRTTGLPAQGAIPTAAAICTGTTVGAMPLPARLAGQKRILTGFNVAYGTQATSGLVEDRLAHMGGLSGVVTTALGINLDVSLLTDNLPERIGSADYSEVFWFMEWYTATGATVATPSFAVTHGDGTTGLASIFNAGSAALPASVAASRRYAIVAASGKPIKSIQSVTMPTTGTAGNFGVTASRVLSGSVGVVGNRIEPVKYDAKTAPIIADNACLSLAALCITTSSGTLLGSLSMAIISEA